MFKKDKYIALLTLFVIVVANLLLSSCSHEDEMAIEEQQSHLGFEVSSYGGIWVDGIMSTRGVEANMSALQTNGMAATAMYSSNSSVLFNNITLSYQSESTVWEPATPYYWRYDNAAMDFNVRYPATSTAITNTSATSFTYDTPTNSSSQVDLLYATVRNLSTPTNGIVPLHLRHALTEVTFSGKLEAGGTNSVFVQGLKLCNYRGTGQFTFPSSATTNSGIPHSGCWSTDGTLKEVVADFSSSISLSTTSSALMAVDEKMMLIPQQLVVWDPFTTINYNNTEEGGYGMYIEVTASIRSNAGIWLFGTSETAGSTIQVAIPTGEWKAEEVYNYELEFLDDRRIAVKLMSVSIGDWDTQDSRTVVTTVIN